MSERKANFVPPGAPAGPYTREPVADQHVEESRKLILAAAAEAGPNRAAVLGAGHCAEIPLAELAARFKQVTVNDVDAAELEKGLAAAHLDEAARAKLDVRIADLTSVTEPLLEKLAAVLAAASDPDAAIEEMSHAVDEQPLADMPLEGKYDLIVASCVLSQLHFGLLHRSAEAYEKRFPGEAERLRENVHWSAALFGLARRMEKKFVDDLAALLAPGGLIYLSDSTQMCHVKLTPAGKWETEGTYRMLQSKFITDYIDRRFVVKASNRWHWLVSPPKASGDVGRMFDVQAMVLRTWRT